MILTKQAARAGETGRCIEHGACITAIELYEQQVAALSQSERLRLAAIILQELSSTAGPLLDYSDAWSDEDLSDVSRFSRHCAAESPLKDEPDA